MKRNRFKYAFLATLLALGQTACSTRSKQVGNLGIGTATATGTATGLGTDIGVGTATASGTGSGSGGGLTTTGTGSGTAGGLTATDLSALRNALNAQAQVNPANGDGGLSAALQAQAKALLDAAAQGKDISAQKIALVGQILQQCAGNVGSLAPIPGQPLMGSWNGAGRCNVAFEVGAHQGNGVYPVSGTYNGKTGSGPANGSMNGKMQADQQGNGAIAADPFSGNVVDSGYNGVSGAGRLMHPTFFKSKAGTRPCTVTVVLNTPKSPIPANYDSAMRQLGKCYRQALVLLSPATDTIFKNNPQLGAQLLQQFLGIQ